MEKRYRDTHITRLHLELTEKCNASCPLCIRNNPDGLRPQEYIGNRELRLADLRKFLSDTVKKNLIEVHMCGSYGDPIMAGDCLDIAEYLCNDRCSVSLSTNGGARSAAWWRSLGRILARNPRSRVDFHIDGLADTNSFYRRNTRFGKIMENAKAFIDAGGQANWEFIPFKHNEHQVEEARELSKKMGFARFTIKKSNWMFSDKVSRISFKDSGGKTHYIEAPSSRYAPVKNKDRVSALDKNVSDEIRCFALLRQELYISCESIVYPCCWTARHARNIYLGRKTKDGFSILFKEYDGRNTFDLNRGTLDDMLHSPFFQKLAECWNSKQPYICYRKCGMRNQPEKIKTWNKR